MVHTCSCCIHESSIMYNLLKPSLIQLTELNYYVFSHPCYPHTVWFSSLQSELHNAFPPSQVTKAISSSHFLFFSLIGQSWIPSKIGHLRRAWQQLSPVQNLGQKWTRGADKVTRSLFRTNLMNGRHWIRQRQDLMVGLWWIELCTSFKWTHTFQKIKIALKSTVKIEHKSTSILSSAMKRRETSHSKEVHENERVLSCREHCR